MLFLRVPFERFSSVSQTLLSNSGGLLPVSQTLQSLVSAEWFALCFTNTVVCFGQVAPSVSSALALFEWLAPSSQALLSPSSGLLLVFRYNSVL